MLAGHVLTYLPQQSVEESAENQTAPLVLLLQPLYQHVSYIDIIYAK